MTRHRPMRVLLALCCGALAIDVNTALLAAFDAAGLPTAHGGLLRLVMLTGAAAFDGTVAAGWWRGVMMPVTAGPGFQIGFHIAVGLAMAVLYAAVVRRLARRLEWPFGFAYAGAVWLLNAAVVLPLIGEGFAGSRTLSFGGMMAFAGIHTVFFALVVALYRHLASVRAVPAEATV